MELKVWVEGIQRIVCGVTVNTTCQDVVFALAHATGKVGRFTLIERWRNNERLLAPNENPLKLLLKWGEYANDVQFILQRSEQNAQKSQQQQQAQQQSQQQQHQLQLAEATNSNNQINNDRNSQTNAVMKKPLGFSNNNNNNNNNNSLINNIINNNNNTNKTSSNNNNNNNQFIDSAKNSATLHKRQQSDDNTTIKELRKSFGAHDAKTIENVGIVKGVPQRVSANRPQPTAPPTSNFSNSPQQRISPQIILPKHEKSHSNPIQMPNTQSPNNSNNNNNNNENNINNLYAQIGPKSKSTNAINLAEVRNALDRGTTAGSPEIMFTTNASSNENLLDIFNGNFNTNNNSNNNNSMEQQQLYNNNVTPTISANGALVPPPYRDPPPPRNSPLQPYKSSNSSSDHSTCQNSPACQNCNGSMMHEIAAHSASVCSNPFLNDYNEFDLDLQGGGNGVVGGGCVGMAEESESIFQATQYNDLLTLIKFQREKITLQQSELSKYDAEIVYLESKERDQAQELEAISREITKADQIFRQGSEQLQTLQYVEEENELVKQQEKTLKSEIALLRSKLANCETELLQCKNKIRILMDDIEVEQRAISNKQKSNRQNVERDFLIEMERIQSEIDQAIHNTDTSNKTTENLKKEILLIENAIAEKKRQVEKLVNEMKEVNLQSLTVTTSEEIKHLLEGSNKPGSSRRIIGSPRQLENAVPTSKNPHGVWV